MEGLVIYLLLTGVLLTALWVFLDFKDKQLQKELDSITLINEQLEAQRRAAFIKGRKPIRSYEHMLYEESRRMKDVTPKRG